MPGPQPRADIVIVVALRTELDAVLHHLPDAQKVVFPQSDNRTYYLGTVASGLGRPYRVAVTLLPRMGNLEAALAANDAIHLWQPNTIAVIGIAGGLRPDEQAFGDIVVANQIFYYEEQKLTDEGPQVRPRMLEPSHQILDRALNYRTNDWTRLIPSDCQTPRGAPRVFVAPIASGEKVFASKDATRTIIAAVPKAAAVEMETAGVAAAAISAVQHVALLVVRAIADFADARKNDRAHALAAATAAAWTIGFLQSGPISVNGLAPIPTKEPATAPLAEREELFREIMQRLDNEEFKTFCFIIGVDVDELPGDRKSAKVRELIKQFERRGELTRLQELWRRKRDEYFS
jgi:nucleoside phosphorylase